VPLTQLILHLLHLNNDESNEYYHGHELTLLRVLPQAPHLYNSIYKLILFRLTHLHIYGKYLNALIGDMVHTPHQHQMIHPIQYLTNVSSSFEILLHLLRYVQCQYPQYVR